MDVDDECWMQVDGTPGASSICIGNMGTSVNVIDPRMTQLVRVRSKDVEVTGSGTVRVRTEGSQSGGGRIVLGWCLCYFWTA